MPKPIRMQVTALTDGVIDKVSYKTNRPTKEQIKKMNVH